MLTPNTQQANPKTNTDFMQFWSVINQILRSHDLPEMLYGEARDYFYELTH